MSRTNNLVAVDFETVYDKDYSLKHMSVHSYLADSRFSAYLVSVYNGDDISYVGLPEKFDWSRLDGYTICAHNASFDEQVYKRLLETGVLKRPVAGCTWACTADLTAWFGVRRNLADASKYLLGEVLSKSVREAMKGKTAEECSADTDVLAYGLKDAVTCYRLAEKYLHLWPLAEQRISRLNREAGYEGIALNMPLVNSGIAALEPRLAVAEASLPWVASGEKPLSANAAKAYGKSVGVPVPASFAKDDPDFIAWAEKYGAQYSWVKAMGEYRSVNTLLNRIKSLRDGRDLKRCRFPYGIKYFGASTGRFSGGAGEDSGGKFNMQNMPRKAMYGVDVRPMFVAAPGKVLIVADYAQVEARFLLWRVGDEAALAPCFKGKSVYQAYAEVTGQAKPGSNLKEEDPEKYKYVKACLSGETLVLTSHGFKRIVDVTLRDQVWDGHSWVSHEGVVCHGKRTDCVCVNGEVLTRDHGVYAGNTPREAVEAGRIPEGEYITYLEGRLSAGPGTCRDSNWALAYHICRIITEQWVVMYRMRVSGVWRRIRAYVAQRARWAHDAVSPVRGPGLSAGQGTEPVGSGT